MAAGFREGFVAADGFRTGCWCRAYRRASKVERLGRKILDFRQLLILGKILERVEHR